MALSGSLSLNRSYNRSVDGGLSITGSLQQSTSFKKVVGGVLAFMGDLSSKISSISLSGTLAFVGRLTLLKNGASVGDFFFELSHSIKIFFK